MKQNLPPLRIFLRVVSKFTTLLILPLLAVNIHQYRLLELTF